MRFLQQFKQTWDIFHRHPNMTNHALVIDNSITESSRNDFLGMPHQTVDGPEIGLHNRWQCNFVSLLSDMATQIKPKRKYC